MIQDPILNHVFKEPIISFLSNPRAMTSTLACSFFLSVILWVLDVQGARDGPEIATRSGELLPEWRDALQSTEPQSRRNLAHHVAWRRSTIYLLLVVMP